MKWQYNHQTKTSWELRTTFPQQNPAEHSELILSLKWNLVEHAKHQLYLLKKQTKTHIKTTQLAEHAKHQLYQQKLAEHQNTKSWQKLAE